MALATASCVVGAAVAIANCSSPTQTTDKPVAAVTSPLTTTQWSLIGPRGFRSQGTGSQGYSGVVLDIAADAAGNLFAGTGSGGVFKYAVASNSWTPLSDNLEYKSIHALWVQPDNSQNMVVATSWNTAVGPSPNGGVRYTTNGGGTWTASKQWGTTDPVPVVLYTLQNDPLDPLIVHAASNGGYWRSGDSGATFSRVTTEAGNITSIAVHPSISGTVYAYKVDAAGGLLKYTGSTLSTLLTWPVPASATCDPTCNCACDGSAAGCIPDIRQLNRTTIALAPSAPNTLYLEAASWANGSPLQGFYRVTINGTNTSWCNLSSRLAGQWTRSIDRNQMISIGPRANPTDPDKILVGGVELNVSTNGGQTFTSPSNSPVPPGGKVVHADLYAGKWLNPTTAYVGTDGGIYHTTDGGVTWSESRNTIPNTQGLGLDVLNVYPYRVFGAGWDIGVHWTCNGQSSCPAGSTWDSWTSGGTLWADSNEVFVDSWGNAGAWATQSSGPPPWSRYRSQDQGASWSGMDTNLSWTPPAPSDRGLLPYFASDRLAGNSSVYTNGLGVFKATGPSFDTWHRVGGPFLDSQGATLGVDQLNVARYVTSSGNLETIIYAPIGGNAKALRVQEGGTWNIRGAGFPAGSSIYRLGVPETGKGPVYALVTPVAHAQKVWITNNNGVSWTPKPSANLPDNVEALDLAVHPLDPRVAYLATSSGVFKTKDQGDNWANWGTLNAGLPEGGYVRHVKTQVHPSGLRVVAQLHGRSNWARPADNVRRMPASRCVPVANADGTMGTMVITANGQVHNSSSTNTLTLWCPMPNDDRFQVLSDKDIEVFNFSQGEGAIKVTHCYAPQAGGNAQCGTELSSGTSAKPLAPAMAGPLSAQDYMFLKIKLGPAITGTIVNVVWGYGYRAGE
jgi:photosystem II stability/assembly factor-like uncharacterized protein